MDPPPPPLPAASNESADGSPRSRVAAAADSLAEDSLPPKLRLMCSFGGHIIPRPHDKSLCYVGGETRMVAVDRCSSLADLSARLSHSLLHGRPFTLKYQLPNEDLDSLITVSTDEDFDNMIDEYDRTSSVSPLKPSRLRLFLFFNVPETAMSMGNLLEDSKSETWFVDALNNAVIPRGLSDSATMGALLNLDGVRNSDSSPDLETQAKTAHEVHSMPDSPIVENSSSYGSSSSSPSMSNLPPIRVRVADHDTGLRPQDQRAGIEEQYAHLTVAPPPPNLNDGFGLLSGLPPPIPSSIVPGNSTAPSAAAPVSHTAAPVENVGRGISDDERSDHGVQVTYRKPPLPLQPVQVQPVQHKAAALYNLPSPDSVASDSSIASASSFSRPVFFEEQSHTHGKDQRGQASPTLKEGISEQTSNHQIPQLQEPTYMVPPQPNQPQQQQQHQQQYVQMSTHYIPHHATATNPVLLQSYYHPVYAPQTQQQLHPHPINQQQQPMYVVSVPQSQAYNMSMQSTVADNNQSVLVSSRPPPSPSPAIVQPSGYKDPNAIPPPVYSTKLATQMKPEMASNAMYSSYINSAPPPLIPIQSNQQYQQQPLGIPQPQSIPVASSAASNYTMDYSHAAPFDQAYYTQHPLPPQYQTMTAAAAMALSDSSKQHPVDMSKHQMTTPQQPI